MKNLRFLSLLVVVAAALYACGGTSDPPGPSIGKDYAFSEQGIQITADTDRAVTDRNIIIAMKRLPLVSGDGHISVFGESKSWMVLSPIHDTIPDQKAGVDLPIPKVRASFIANDSCIMSWRIQLGARQDYFFFAFVDIDSVYAPKRGRLISVNDDEELTLAAKLKEEVMRRQQRADRHWISGDNLTAGGPMPTI